MAPSSNLQSWNLLRKEKGRGYEKEEKKHLHMVSLTMILYTKHILIYCEVALGARYRKFYRTLNNAKNPFNSIFNFKKNQKY